MKQILLLRHAKSSWDDSSLKDFDRPLAKRGRGDAPRMGRFLREIGYIPGHIASSPAQRAKETILMFAEAAEIAEDMITWNEDLYYGSYRDYLAAVQETPDEVERVLLVGHNPKMEDTAGALCGDETEASIRMPTAALACFEHPANRWERVRPGTAQLKWMMIPKVVKKIL